MNVDLFVSRQYTLYTVTRPNFDSVPFDTPVGPTQLHFNSVSFDPNYENYSKLDEWGSVCVCEINWSVAVCFSVCFNLNLFAEHLVTEMSNVG